MAIGTAAAIIGGSLIGGASSLIGADKAAGATSDAARAANAEQARQFDLVRSDTAPLRALGNSAIDRINRLYGYGSSTSATTPTGSSASLSFADFVKSRGGYAGFGSANGRYENVVDMGAAQKAYQNYLASQPAAPATSAGGTGGTGTPDMSAFFESPDYQFNLGETEKAINRGAAASGRYDSGAVRLALNRNASGLASREFASFYDRLAQQAGLGSTGIGMSASAGANAANQMGANIVNAGNTRASAYMQGASGVNSAVQGGLQNTVLLRYLNQGNSGGGTYGGPYSMNYSGPLYGGGLS